MSDQENHRRLSGRQRKKTSKLQDSPSSAVIYEPQPPQNSIDASVFSVEGLLYMFDRQRVWASRLDFLNCSDAMIQQLFVTARQLRKKHGDVLLPPKALRRSRASITNFFDSATDVQKRLIRQYAIFDDKYAASSNTQHHCHGITMIHIKTSTITDERREQIENGYVLLLRESLQIKYEMLHPDNHTWPPEYTFPIAGALLLRDKHGPKEHIEWVVEEIPNYPIDEKELRHITVRHVGCSRVSDDPNRVCSQCYNSRKSLFRKCVDKYNLLSSSVSKNTTHATLRRNPSLTQERMQMYAAQVHSLQQKYYEKVTKKLMDSTGIEMPINEQTNELFHQKNMDHYIKFIRADTVTNSTLAEYIVGESFRKHNQARERGSTSVRHCPLTIRLGMMLKKNLGFKGGLYNLVAKCLGLPHSSSLRNYQIPTSNEPDGILIPNLRKEKTSFDTRNPNADKLSWRRCVSVKFDTMHCKSGLIDNGNGEVVGWAHDAFEESAIKMELAEVKACDRTEQQLAEEGEEDVKTPKLTKQFQVFMATSWSPTDERGVKSKHEFVVAIGMV